MHLNHPGNLAPNPGLQEDCLPGTSPGAREVGAAACSDLSSRVKPNVSTSLRKQVY